MAKYTGVTQSKDGSWSYRIKKKVNGQVVDTRIKKDENGLPFLIARAAYEAKSKQEAPVTQTKQRSMWKIMCSRNLEIRTLTKSK